MGLYKSLKVKGKEFVREYQAVRDKSTNELWLVAYDVAASDTFVVNAVPISSAIDTELPYVDPKDIYHIMLNGESKANWAIAPAPNPSAHAFEEYPDISLEDWHKKNDCFKK
ncbi:hypothetical protein DFQ29_006820 [Apophysomyces sp. BC1021]|nr:hypothetical protein DFQ29_006820 [Apophysomyces sp. BC1021]